MQSRGCVDGSAASLLNPLGFPNVCKDYPVLIAEDQHCQTAGNGYQFLLLHRHMIQTLKQLWPKHAADFDGFPKFPTTKAELPAVWNASDPTWNAQVLAAAAIADNIEQHLDKFPSEGALGYWLQCPVGNARPPGLRRRCRTSACTLISMTSGPEVRPASTGSTTTRRTS